jgi:hypothetical protein
MSDAGKLFKLPPPSGGGHEIRIEPGFSPHIRKTNPMGFSLMRLKPEERLFFYVWLKPPPRTIYFLHLKVEAI